MPDAAAGVPEDRPPRVLVLDDHALLVHALVMALRAEGCEAHAPALVSTVRVLEDVGAHHPDVVLLDLDLGPDVGDGVHLVPGLVARGARVVVMSGASDVTRPAAALEAGAVGYVSKSEPFERLLGAVLDAARGREVMSGSRRHGLLAALRRRRSTTAAAMAPFEALTSRERQVLAALVDGVSVARIAERDVVAEATVRSQVRAVLVKLGVSSQLAAVARARDAGWQPPGTDASLAS